MREINFRGKAVMSVEELDSMKFLHVNGWLIGNLIANGDKFFLVGDVVENTGEFINFEWWAEVVPETVGQFAGLLDRNGKGVYEGDVIKCSDFMSDFNSVVKHGEYEQDSSAGEYTPTKCMGFYAEAIEKDLQTEWGTYLVPDYKETSSLQSFDQVEIIGDIYENPELLEVPE